MKSRCTRQDSGKTFTVTQTVIRTAPPVLLQERNCGCYFITESCNVEETVSLGMPGESTPFNGIGSTVFSLFCSALQVINFNELTEVMNALWI